MLDFVKNISSKLETNFNGPHTNVFRVYVEITSSTLGKRGVAADGSRICGVVR